jgi:hypothetical protein
MKRCITTQAAHANTAAFPVLRRALSKRIAASVSATEMPGQPLFSGKHSGLLMRDISLRCMTA